MVLLDLIIGACGIVAIFIGGFYIATVLLEMGNMAESEKKSAKRLGT